MSIANPIVSRQPLKPVTEDTSAIQSLMVQRGAKMGRPTKYTEEIAAEICDEVLNGKALHVLAKERDNLPTLSTIYLWLDKYQDFQENYARAQALKAHTLAQETVSIADGCTNDDWKPAQLRVNARQWLSGKLSRETYGDGPAAGASQSLTINVVGIADQVDARLSNLIERAEEGIIEGESREIDP